MARTNMSVKGKKVHFDGASFSAGPVFGWALAALTTWATLGCGSRSVPQIMAEPDPVAGTADSPAALPMVFRLAADAPEFYGSGTFSLRETLESAMRTWNDAAGVPLFRLEGVKSSSMSSAFDPRRSIVDDENVFYVFKNGSQASFDVLPESRNKDILGVCYRQGSGADIALTLSPEHASLAATDVVASPNEMRAFDLQSVAVHELGHAIGFGHDIYNRASVMWANGLEVGAVNRRLSASDKQVLVRILSERYNIRISVNNTDDPEPPVLRSGAAM